MVSVGWGGPRVADRFLSLRCPTRTVLTTLPPCVAHLCRSRPNPKVNVWDTATRKLLYKLPGHTGSVNEVVYNPKVGAGGLLP